MRSHRKTLGKGLRRLSQGGTWWGADIEKVSGSSGDIRDMTICGLSQPSTTLVRDAKVHGLFPLSRQSQIEGEVGLSSLYRPHHS